VFWTFCLFVAHPPSKRTKLLDTASEYRRSLKQVRSWRCFKSFHAINLSHCRYPKLKGHQFTIFEALFISNLYINYDFINIVDALFIFIDSEISGSFRGLFSEWLELVDQRWSRIFVIAWIQCPWFRILKSALRRFQVWRRVLVTNIEQFNNCFFYIPYLKILFSYRNLSVLLFTILECLTNEGFLSLISRSPNLFPF
jgi:hypothetical protein